MPRKGLRRCWWCRTKHRVPYRIRPCWTTSTSSPPCCSLCKANRNKHELSGTTPSPRSDGKVSKTDPGSPIGLPSQRNWMYWLDRPEIEGASPGYEYPLYSDAHITGEFREGLGPYCFLNSVPMNVGSGLINAPIVLRTAIHLPGNLPDISKPDDTLYHGGTLADELAALTSLALGVRTLAGGISREFGFDGDPLGRPREGWSEPKPTFHTRNHELILPSVVGSRSMQALEILKSIPSIDPGRYVQLIRACRSYQQALWTAESDPNVAWLLLVSALETAANDEVRSDATPDEIFKTSKPELAKYLKDNGGPNCLRTVAESIAPTLKSTRKFIDFTTGFMPPEPDKRPSEEWLQVNWSKSRMRRILSKVYDYRSLSLHEGKPFPEPMLRPPFRRAPREPASERPLMGITSYSLGGTWAPKDAPINLHCFHYIARGALLNWWKRSLASANSLHGSQSFSK